MPTDERTVEIYSSNPDAWMQHKSFAHTHLEKPAMYKEVGEVNGKNVLCLGCGAGEECAHLTSKGARVTGIDISPKLIEKAKENCPEAILKVMDVEMLDFPDATFDLVYSSLVLHYLEDWSQVLGEVKRVLKPQGVFIFSTHHPVYWGAQIRRKEETKEVLLGFEEKKNFKQVNIYGDYIKKRKIEGELDGEFKVTYHHRSFSTMLNEMRASKLKLIDCIEPLPLDSAREEASTFFEKHTKIPLFVIFKLQKDANI